MLGSTHRCTSSRLMGVELEYDSGSQTFSYPTVDGWDVKRDGSLSNGMEFVVEPALPMSVLDESVKRFTTAWKSYRNGMTSRGGFHVHVQANDLTVEQVRRLLKLYMTFQPVINTLVGKTRLSSNYCRQLTPGMIEQSVQAIETPSRTSRGDARSYAINRQSVVNVSMMDCLDPDERSIEFRQASPSRRYSCIYGWAVFCHAMVEIARTGRVAETASHEPVEPTLDLLKQLCADAMRPYEAAWIGDWIQWRYDEMNPVVTPEDVIKLVLFMTSRTRPAGLFTLSKKLDWCYPKVKAVSELAISEGKLAYRRTYNHTQLACPPNHQRILEQLSAAAERRAQEAVQQALDLPTTPLVDTDTIPTVPTDPVLTPVIPPLDA